MKTRILKTHYDNVYSAVESWLRAVGAISEEEFLQEIPGAAVDKTFQISIIVGKHNALTSKVSNNG